MKSISAPIACLYLSPWMFERLEPLLSRWRRRDDAVGPLPAVASACFTIRSRSTARFVSS